VENNFFTIGSIAAGLFFSEEKIVLSKGRKNTQFALDMWTVVIITVNYYAIKNGRFNNNRSTLKLYH